jgi:hypothetical protein
MLIAIALILSFAARIEADPKPHGIIEGIVVDGSARGEPLGDIRVILRAVSAEGLKPLAETHSDTYGKFVFRDLPIGCAYLPGAERDGVYYPASRVALDQNSLFGQATIVTFSAVESPSPLVIEKREIDVQIKDKTLQVNEVLVISNRSRTTYVGKLSENHERETLRLNIPGGFDRVTFENEFYGRHFRIVDHTPTTEIPWPPGQRELKFSYEVPTDLSSHLQWMLDIPCNSTYVRVRGEHADMSICNLNRLRTGNGYAEFSSCEKKFDSGFQIVLSTGVSPFPWALYARCATIGILSALIFSTIVVQRWRRRVEKARIIRNGGEVISQIAAA